MQKKFAIAGCGRIGKRHAEQISRAENVKTVCDIIPEKANIPSMEINVKVYAREMRYTQSKESRYFSAGYT